MNRLHKTELTSYAQKLRKEMTKEERHLWYDFLKSLPENVRRQKIIGVYIADFCITSAKIVIELDGSQHYDEEGKTKDAIRDTYFRSLGYRILRYSNADVNQRFDEVCQDIWNHLKASP